MQPESTLIDQGFRNECYLLKSCYLSNRLLAFLYESAERH
jgi:hypothetical protein